VWAGFELTLIFQDLKTSKGFTTHLPIAKQLFSFDQHSHSSGSKNNFLSHLIFKED